MTKEIMYGGSMTDWALAVRNSGRGAMTLDESQEVKLAGQKMLEVLGLPRLKSLTLPLGQFLRDPRETFNELHSRQYHVTLLSQVDGTRRRAFPITQKRVGIFIEQNVSSSELDQHTLILKEFHRNIYGGNIVIEDDGGVVLEVVTGDHIHSVLGDKKIHVFGSRNPTSHQFKFCSDCGNTKNMANQRLSSTLFETINCIPKIEVSGEVRQGYYEDFYPGYYEFVLVRKGLYGLKPVFIDYRGKVIGKDNYRLNR